MNIFYRRPLFTACILFLGASATAYFFSAQAKIIILAFFAVVLIVAAFMLLLAKISDKVKYFLINSVLCSLAILLAMGISFSYFDIKYEKFEKLYDKEHTVEAIVLSKTYESEFFSSYSILVSKIDGQEIKHEADLICEYITGADVGDSIILKATAKAPTDNKDGIFNEKLLMLSNNKFVIYTSYDDTGSIITDHNKNFNIKLIFAKWNDAISDIITERVPGEAGNLASAILLGNKQLLSSITKRDFSRAGVSHILALSGMHMTIIMGAFTSILWVLTKKAKKIGLFASIAAVFYLALTGFSVSALRAVLMLLIVYFSMIIFNEPDPLTSLSISGFLIVAFLPGSILDAGFWMSFSATLGLLVLMPPFHDFMVSKLYLIFRGRARRIIVKVIASVPDIIMASLFAIMPLIIVMCIFIKEMSVFSIVSSAVLSLPSSALILLTLMLSCFFYIPFVSQVLVFLIQWIGNFMLDFCAVLSDKSDAVFSLNYPFITLFAIILGFALLYFFVSKHKRKIVSAIPFACCILLLAATINVYECKNSNKLKATYINASQVSDMVVISNQNKVFICDISNGSKSSYSKVLDAVYAARATEIQAIMLTGYTYDHVATFHSVFASNIVRSVWMPYPENSDEYYKMNKIYELANRFGIDTYVYKDGEIITIFENTDIQVYQDRIDRSAVPITLISISTSNERLLYTSPAFNESGQYELTEKLFADSDYVIFGSKGPRVKSVYTITNNRKIDAIAFSSKELISFFDTEVIRGSAYFYVPDKIEFYLDK